MAVSTLQSFIAGRWVGARAAKPLHSAINGRLVAHTHEEGLDFAESLAYARGTVLPALLRTHFQDRARVLKALADPARLRLVSMVAAHEGGEACVCDLTEPLGLSQPTVSHHLKVLVEAGFLTRSKRGTWAYYRIVPGSLEGVAGLLAGV